MDSESPSKRTSFMERCSTRIQSSSKSCKFPTSPSLFTAEKRFWGIRLGAELLSVGQDDGPNEEQTDSSGCGAASGLQFGGELLAVGQDDGPNEEHTDSSGCVAASGSHSSGELDVGLPHVDDFVPLEVLLMGSDRVVRECGKGARGGKREGERGSGPRHTATFEI